MRRPRAPRMRNRACPNLDAHFRPTGRDYVRNMVLAFGAVRFFESYHGSIDHQSALHEFARLGDPRIPATCDSPARLQKGNAAFFKKNPDPVVPGSPLEPANANLRAIGEILGLDAAENALLCFVATLTEDHWFRVFCASSGTYAIAQAHTILAMATGISETDVRRALSPNGRLVGSGLLAVEEYACTLDDRFSLKRGLSDMLTRPDLTRESFVRHFLPEAKGTELEITDFQHLSTEVNTVHALLRGAITRKQRGVNVLFVGPTGTGKSALAALIASNLGVRLHTAGIADSDGDAANPGERLSSLLLGQRLFGGTDGMLLFDELEDLFAAATPSFFGPTKSRAMMSKVWFNLLLEDNPAPTIWISNSVDGVDPAFLRRFSYVVPFRPAGPKERERVLNRHLQKTEISPVEIAMLARRFAASPAQIATAVTTASLVSETGRPTLDVLERVLGPMETLVSGHEPTRREDFDPKPFRLDGIRAQTDLVVLADQLAGWKEGPSPGISACFYGPPGTGKSEYARYLAFRSGRPIVYRRGSDLISKWVGESEKNIAEAFREAESEGALLVFDEVDTFLRNREQARQSWEVTQVNEFLQQLEAFRGMVVCTTNLLKDLDPAALRRFVFKVEFSFAGATQAKVLFESLLAEFLPQPLTLGERSVLERELSRMNTLAPGDFAAVARRLRALRAQATMAELLAALADELKVKQTPRATSGF